MRVTSLSYKFGEVRFKLRLPPAPQNRELRDAVVELATQGIPDDEIADHLAMWFPRQDINRTLHRLRYSSPEHILRWLTDGGVVVSLTQMRHEALTPEPVWA